MSAKLEEFHCDSFMKSMCTDKGPCKRTTSDSIVLSETSSDVSIINGMCINSVSSSDEYFYKRRKLQGNSIVLLPEGNTAGNTDGVCACGDPCKKQSIDLHTSDGSFLDSSNVDELEVLPKESDAKSCTENQCLNAGDSHLSSQSGVQFIPASFKKEKEETVVYSLPASVELPSNFASIRDRCIHVLKSDGLLGRSWPSSDDFSLKIMSDDTIKLNCKTCGLLEDPINMLICDHCEEAYHISCCIPRVEELTLDEWYCLPCSKNKSKPLSPCGAGGSSNHTNRIYRGKYSISFMLKDTTPYTYGARIGKDFQAEVPDYSYPLPNDDDSFAEPIELDSTELAKLHVWSGRTTPKHSSIGNWIQCREVIYSHGSDEGNMCGKWRRVPLFLEQSDDWDCSCSVMWDPIHADCAVPQELDTKEVLKHLKFIKQLRTRLTDKNRTSSPS